MSERRHLKDRAPCPHLPQTDEVLTAEVMRRFGRDYDA